MDFGRLACILELGCFVIGTTFLFVLIRPHIDVSATRSTDGFGHAFFPNMVSTRMQACDSLG